MKNFEHYKRGYYMPPVQSTDWVNKEYIDKAPAWCSVDLRDGNQALIIPMSLDEKLEFFKELVRVGFKEIEVGFPAASETEYKFCRTLIEENLIPDDVTIQVLTQAREHIIKKTFEAIQGAKNVVVHLYNSTSYAQRTQVFKKSKEEILKIATDGAKLLNDMADQYGVQLTKGQMETARSAASIGVEMQDLASALNLEEKLNEYQATKGIPTDSVDGKMSQFQDWVKMARDNNGSEMKLAIKADAGTPYKTIKKMMSELQDMSENRYYLITALKSNSED